MMGRQDDRAAGLEDTMELAKRWRPVAQIVEDERCNDDVDARIRYEAQR